MSRLEAANTGNDLFKIANWQKDKQNVSVIMVTDPTDATKKNLVIALSTQ